MKEKNWKAYGDKDCVYVDMNDIVGIDFDKVYDFGPDLKEKTLYKIIFTHENGVVQVASWEDVSEYHSAITEINELFGINK